MDAVHVHLMLNHVPVLGVLFGTALLVYALFRPSTEMKRLSFGLFVIAAVVAIPVYLTGEPAEHRVEGLPGVSHTIVEEHEDAAKVAFIGMIALGSIALAGLVWSWRKSLFPQWLAAAVLLAAVVVSLLSVWTANLGGKVRHSEIRPDGLVQSTAAQAED